MEAIAVVVALIVISLSKGVGSRCALRDVARQRVIILSTKLCISFVLFAINYDL